MLKSAVGEAVDPVFVPRAPWLNGDLQTVRNVACRWLGRPPPDLTGFPSERLVFVMPDGDRLVATLNRPRQSSDQPLALLIHGLTGCEASDYVLRSAAQLLARGHPTLRLNLRGAGPSRPLCRDQYHAGRSDDLRVVIAGLESRLLAGGVVLVGFSLGANMLLKLLGEDGGAASGGPVRAAVAVSAPIDLEATSRRMMQPRNRLYQAVLLHWMKREATAPAAALTPGERRHIASARTVYAFDDVFVAPRHGFGSAATYYRLNQARRFLADIRVPTLMIHALDDPWIPAGPYLAFDWNCNRRLTVVLPRHGGHVGFHGRGSKIPWHDRCIARFLDDVLAAG